MPSKTQNDFDDYTASDFESLLQTAEVDTIKRVAIFLRRKALKNSVGGSPTAVAASEALTRAADALELGEWS